MKEPMKESLKEPRKGDDFDSWLASELHNRAEHIEDNGFSSRVMARLPAVPAPRRSTQIAWVSGWLLAVLSLLVWYPPLAGTLLGVASWASTLSTLDVVQLLYLGAGVLAAVGGAVAAILWWDGARPV